MLSSLTWTRAFIYHLLTASLGSLKVIPCGAPKTIPSDTKPQLYENQFQQWMEAASCHSSDRYADPLVVYRGQEPYSFHELD